jgi:hypothetical protein
MIIRRKSRKSRKSQETQKIQRIHNKKSRKSRKSTETDLNKMATLQQLLPTVNRQPGFPRDGFTESLRICKNSIEHVKKYDHGLEFCEQFFLFEM